MSRNVETDFKNCQDQDNVENQDLTFKTVETFWTVEMSFSELSRLKFLIKTTSKI